MPGVFEKAGEAFAVEVAENAEEQVVALAGRTAQQFLGLEIGGLGCCTAHARVAKSQNLGQENCAGKAICLRLPECAVPCSAHPRGGAL